MGSVAEIIQILFSVHIISRLSRPPRPPTEVTIKEERYVKLCELKKNLRARKLLLTRGKLFINGEECNSKTGGDRLIDLQTSKVETRQTTPFKKPQTYLVPVWLISSSKPREIIYLKCFKDSKLEDLKVLLQDHVGIPASELTFEKNVDSHQIAIEFKGKCVIVHDPKSAKLIDRVPDDVMTQRGILFASEKVNQWKDLAEIGLGLEESETDAIVNDNKDHMKEQRYKALLIWLQRKGREATWKALVRGCCRIKNLSLAEKMVNVYEECKWISATPSPIEPPITSVNDRAMSARVRRIGRLNEERKGGSQDANSKTVTVAVAEQAQSDSRHSFNHVW